MTLNVPLILVVAAFDVLFLAVFVYRRMTDSPPLPGVLSYIAQSGFIAVNCLLLFPDEVAYYVSQLRRLL